MQHDSDGTGDRYYYADLAVKKLTKLKGHHDDIIHRILHNDWTSCT